GAALRERPCRKSTASRRRVESQSHTHERQIDRERKQQFSGRHSSATGISNVPGATRASFHSGNASVILTLPNPIFWSTRTVSWSRQPQHLRLIGRSILIDGSFGSAFGNSRVACGNTSSGMTL